MGAFFRTLYIMRFRRALLVAALLTFGCDETSSGADGAGTPDAASGTGGSAGGGAGGSPAGGSGGQATASCATADGDVVTFTTGDGVELAADLYTTGERGQAGVVLLHMIPPGNTRSNYPPEFITALTSRGLSVLNVDRRGAGASQGTARDAYEGPNGKLDAVAAGAFLTGHECAIDGTRIAYVGASNGTTTALDVTVHSETEPSVSTPAALVFLTGGNYTENQNAIGDHRTLLDAVPIQFVYSTAEAAWSSRFDTADAPAAWEFEEYSNGAHGTAMFGAVPESIDTVAEFLAARLGSR